MSDVEKYDVQSYWSEVADRIDSRDGHNIIAGDDEPYYVYKRQEFLRLLTAVDYKGKSILEVGSGPGGNLNELSKLPHGKLSGIDISSHMIALARKILSPDVTLYKTEGTGFDLPSNNFDIVFCATVLQHNTDEKMLFKLIEEMSRVSSDRVYIYERIEKKIKGDVLNIGRPVSYYAQLFEKNGMKLVSTQFSYINTSYYVCGIIRKVFNKSTRIEGEPLSKFSIFLQNITLPITKIIDKIIKVDRDLARLEFKKIR